MPSYHSSYNEAPNTKVISSLSILPIKTKVKGNAPPAPAEGDDIIDEVLNYFKANVMFRNFDPKGPADRLLVYLTLYVSQCLSKIPPNANKTTAEQALYTLAIEKFALPGDKSFVLGGFVTAPASRAEEDTLRTYLTQVRQELGLRLVARVYARNATVPDKWWMCFLKRKFLNKAL
eukprot:TRINITY_DN23914_c0_g1_i1.p2 TRINITY_DN23914_c0_g1~~TRINITY_DN23914_c0_g1_i1.p2  ORF type:complete len:176 (-),score=60.61 TRINITY_DN23914_c0_g1_i1:225-752(-)